MGLSLPWNHIKVEIPFHSSKMGRNRKTHILTTIKALFLAYERKIHTEIKEIYETRTKEPSMDIVQAVKRLDRRSNQLI
jgi:predicted house-cleaning noncanonical NTP pyrophosphatase (MazG superfamily)